MAIRTTERTYLIPILIISNSIRSNLKTHTFYYILLPYLAETISLPKLTLPCRAVALRLAFWLMLINYESMDEGWLSK
jgi:hypothetical protein